MSPHSTELNWLSDDKQLSLSEKPANRRQGLTYTSRSSLDGGNANVWLCKLAGHQSTLRYKQQIEGQQIINPQDHIMWQRRFFYHNKRCVQYMWGTCIIHHTRREITRSYCFFFFFFFTRDAFAAILFKVRMTALHRVRSGSWWNLDLMFFDTILSVSSPPLHALHSPPY